MVDEDVVTEADKVVFRDRGRQCPKNTNSDRHPRRQGARFNRGAGGKVAGRRQYADDRVALPGDLQHAIITRIDNESRTLLAPIRGNAITPVGECHPRICRRSTCHISDAMNEILVERPTMRAQIIRGVGRQEARGRAGIVLRRLKREERKIARSACRLEHKTWHRRARKRVIGKYVFVKDVNPGETEGIIGEPKIIERN